MKTYSLTIRMALLFGALSFLTLSLIGANLYRDLEAQVARRDDAALIAHVEFIHKLLQDSATVELLRKEPRVFESMLSSPDALLIIRFAGKPPLIKINHSGFTDSEFSVEPNKPLFAAGEIRHVVGTTGIPFITAATSIRPAGFNQNIEVIIGRTTSESAHFLEYCRNRILAQITIGALLFASAGFLLVRRGLLPLKRLVGQAEKITVSNLAARIDKTGAPKELHPVIDSFNAMLERLGKGFSQLSQVSADMAHDLRTPINNLLGQTEVALSQSRSVDYWESLLASNLEELQRLSKMIDSMLFLARSENAEIAIERKYLNAEVEFQCVAEYFEGLAELRNIRIVVQAKGDIFADPMLLRRALANLTSNAVQYADPGTAIYLKAEPIFEGTKLVVENSGPTIDAAHLNRLFDRFYRVDASRCGSANSSGLGLSIVRSIMTLHQGSWDAISANGITRFSLFFPSQVAQRT